MTVSARIGELPTRSGNATIWLCTLQSNSVTSLDVRVLRLLPEKPGVKIVPSAAGKKGKAVEPVVPVVPSDQPAHPGFVEQGGLIVVEHDRSTAPGAPVDATKGVQRAQESKLGSVTLTLKSKPTLENSLSTWDITIESRVEKGHELRVLAKSEAGGFVEVAAVRGTTFTPAQLNAQTARSIKATVKPVPRLCVGLIAATPPPVVDGYRGVTKASGSVEQFGQDRRPEDLDAVLQRIYFLLDAPGTLDNAWDSESLTSSSELRMLAQTNPDVATADEVWARQIVEMTLGVPYDSPLNPANEGRGTRPGTLSNMPFCGARLGAAEPNPIIGVVFACQQLATVGILSRGEYASKGELNAGALVAQTTISMKRDGGQIGRWFVVEPALREIDKRVADQLLNDPTLLTGSSFSADLKETIALSDYGPGSVHLFSNATVTEKLVAYDQIEAALAINPPDKDGRTQAAGEDFGSKFVPAFQPNGKAYMLGGKQCRFLLSVRLKEGKVKRAQQMCHPVANVERDNQGAAHIGFAVRVRNAKAQFLDTGGLNAPGRDTAETQVLFSAGKNGMHGGTMDDALADQARSLGSPYRGAGLFGKLKPEQAKRLVDHVAGVLRKARYIGLARLYLLAPNTVIPFSENGNYPQVRLEQVLYASPVRPMYDLDDPADNDFSDEQRRAASVPDERNYSIARYAWSLRGLPSSRFQAVWVIYSALFPLVDEMIKPGRNNPLAALGEDAVKRTKIVRGCLTRAGGNVTLISAAALGPLGRLEGRGGQRQLQFTRGQRMTPSNVAKYFQDV